MPVNVVQSRSTQSSATGTSLGLAFASALAAGDSIHAIGTCDAVNTTTISSFSDGTNAYGAVLDQSNDSTNAQSIGQAVAQNVAAGTPTVTMNLAATRTFRGIWIKEIGTVTSAPLDGHTGQLQASVPTTTDGVTTTTGASNANQPALISAVFIETKDLGETLSAGTGFGTTPSGEGSGWTGIYGDAKTEGFSENKRITTTGAVAATATASSSSNYLSVMAIFDEAAAPAFVPGPPVAQPSPSRDWSAAHYQTRAPASLPSGVGLAVTPRSPVLGPAERRDYAWSTRDYQVLPQYRVLPQGVTIGLPKPTAPIEAAYRREPWPVPPPVAFAPPPAPVRIPFAPPVQPVPSAWRGDQFQIVAAPTPPSSVALTVPAGARTDDAAYRRDPTPLQLRPAFAPIAVPVFVPASQTLIPPGAFDRAFGQVFAIEDEFAEETLPSPIPPPTVYLDPAYRREPPQTQLVTVYAPIVPPARILSAPMPQFIPPAWRLDQFQIIAPPRLPAGAAGAAVPSAAANVDAAYRRDPWPQQLLRASVTSAGAAPPPYSPPIAYDRRDWSLLAYQVPPSAVPRPPAPFVPYAPPIVNDRRDWSLLAYDVRPRYFTLPGLSQPGTGTNRFISAAVVGLFESGAIIGTFESAGIQGGFRAGSN